MNSLVTGDVPGDQFPFRVTGSERLTDSRVHMHLNHGLRQRIGATKRLLRILWNYRVARSDSVGYNPYRLWIEPTAICNLQCPHCPNKELARREYLGFMDFKLFTKVIDEATQWVHDVNLHHRGESLLHPRFFDMVKYGSRRGIFTKLHTNATLLDEITAKRVLDSGLSLISFSFDGFDPMSYKRHRPPAKFESTLENILRFLRLKKERKQRTPITVLEVLDFPGTEEAIREGKDLEFLHRFDRLPLDRLIVKRPHNWGGTIPVEADLKDAEFVPCTFPWHSLVVMWDGKISPCPHDFMGEIVVGNATKQGLREVFNSPAMVRLRRQMIDRRPDQSLPCFACDSVRRKALLGIPMASLRYLR